MTDVTLDEIVNEIDIAATPARVFQALVSAEQVPQWWGGKGGNQAYLCQKFESELRVGGKWRCSGITGSGGPFEVSGEYIDIDPPHKLSTTWIASWTGTAQTVVRWELTETNSGTHVVVRHSGLSRYPEIAQAYRGWPGMLRWLQALLEKHETAQQRFGT
ncbi:MAG TPA: SRPBCC domain-containing protein [Candidatus Koribacter sp.]|jgi:uncharacterized protein YndB with AHSA1/START domain